MQPKLNPEQLEIAIDLQRKCYTHQRIAEELGTHRTTVSRSLAAYNRKVTDRLLKRAYSQRARQFERLDWTIEQAIDQWHRSKLDAESVKVTEGGGEDGGDKTETTTKGQTGDPRYLAEIRAALADQRKVLGIDAEDDAKQAIEIVVKYEDRQAAQAPSGPDDGHQ